MRGIPHSLSPALRLSSDRVGYILLAGMNEMYSLPIGAGKRLNCDRVKYNCKRRLDIGLAEGQPSPIQTSIKSGRVTVAGHPKDDAALGTLKSILRQAELKD